MKKLLPLVALVLVAYAIGNAQTKYLWATARIGGANGFGSIVQGDSDGTNFHLVYSFDTLLGNPTGKIVMAGNGLICGTTETGIIYSYNPGTHAFTSVHSFGNCQQAYGLVSGNNGKLYGVAKCEYGRINNYGQIFSFEPANNNYTVVHYFDSLSWIESNTFPIYNTVQLLPANDGKLYGLAMSHAGAVLFAFDPANNSYTILHSIRSWGGRPFASTLMQASNGKIYGAGGYTFFSYDPVNAVYDSLYRFDTYDHGTPASGLAEADNGKLYGVEIMDIAEMTQIYSYDIATDSFSLPFMDSAIGPFPTGNMCKLSNGKLVFANGENPFSTVRQPGAYISFDVNNNTTATLIKFDVTNGMNPESDILEASTIVNGISAPAHDASFDLSPNPANNILFIHNINSNTPYIITNVLGQEVMKGIIESTTRDIDISSLPAGMYLLNGVKFVKE